MNDVWHVIMHQKSFKNSLRCLGVPPILQEKVKYRTGVIDSPPLPAVLATDLDADLSQNPDEVPDAAVHQ